jgi:hypothetical protein
MNAEKTAPVRLTPRRMLLLAIALLLIVGLGWLLRDFVRDSILLPLINLMWVIWVLIQSIPQFVFWGLFLLLALVVAARSLIASQPVAAVGGGMWTPRRSNLSRYRFWQRGLESMHGNSFSRERIVRELQLLTLQVLAEHDRVPLDEMRSRLLNGQLDLSGEEPAIRSLLEASQARGLFAEPSDRPRGLLAWLASLFGRAPKSELVHQIDVPAIVAWLEKETGKLTPERGDALGTEYR